MMTLRSSNYKYLLVGFTDWLMIRGYAPKTIEAYPKSLKEFFYYLEQQNILNIQKVAPKHSRMFKLHLQNRGNKVTKSSGICNQSINGILKVINCFSKYISESQERFKCDIYEDYLPVDIAEKTVLLQDEVKAMYMATFESYPKTLSSQEMGLRDRAIIAVFYGCGLRLNEGRNLNLDDIDFLNKRLLVRKGKGNKQRYVPIANQHLEDLREYIQRGRYWFTEHHNSKHNGYKYSIKKKTTKEDKEGLLLNVFGKRMKYFEVRLKYLCSKGGVQKQVGTHSLRHSVASHMLQNGLELEQIQRFLGHQSIDTTQVYTHLVEKLENELKHFQG